MQCYICPWMDLSFYGVLGLQKVKIHEKFDFLPLFGTAESCLGRISFWPSKWTLHSKILVGLESRLTDLSKKPTLAQFGHLQVPQTQLQRGATRQAGGATCQAVFCQIALYSPENADLTQFDFLGLKMIIFDVIILTLRHFYSCLTLLEDSFM